MKNQRLTTKQKQEIKKLRKNRKNSRGKQWTSLDS